MKAFSVVLLGLFITACFAQDGWFEKDTFTLVNSATSDYETQSSVYLGGHLYALVCADVTKTDVLNPTYGAVDANAPSHTSVLIDLTQKKSVYLGYTSSTSSYFLPTSLSTDGQYLYVSLLRDGSNIDLKDKFETTQGVCGVLYKIDKNLQIVDRVVSVNSFAAFISSTVLPDGKPVFMLKSASGSSDVSLKHNTKDAFSISNSKSGGLFIYADLFEDTPVLLNRVDGQSWSAEDVSGSLLATGDGDTFIASFNTKTKLTQQLIKVGGDSHVVGSAEFTVAKPVTDDISIVRLDSTSFASVFVYGSEIKKGTDSFCGQNSGTPKLVFIKHEISSDGITSSDPKCVAIGASTSDYNVYESYKTAVIPHTVDHKILLATHFRGFNFDFCGTKIFTNQTAGEGKAAMVFASVDSDSLDCVSAQPVDPVSNQKVKGFTALDNDQYAVLEFFQHPKDKLPVMKTRVFKYVRCEDGVIDRANEECVCFDGGLSCKHRTFVASSSAPSSSATPSGASSTASASSSGAPSSHSHSKSSKIAQSNSSSITEEKSPVLAIVLLALTAAFLVAAVVFLILFICA